jgi:hypothetical protein
MALLDLDNQEVSQDLYDKANEMTSIFHGFCTLWAEEDVRKYGEEAALPPFERLGANGSEYNHELGYYWGFRAITQDLGHPFGWTTVSIYVAVSDELGGLDLVGFYERGELIYLISRVDTTWSDVWTAQYPTGLIDEDHPFIRQGRYTNLP